MCMYACVYMGEEMLQEQGMKGVLALPPRELCMHVYMHVCVCVYIYIYIYISY